MKQNKNAHDGSDARIHKVFFSPESGLSDQSNNPPFHPAITLNDAYIGHRDSLDISLSSPMENVATPQRLHDLINLLRSSSCQQHTSVDRLYLADIESWRAFVEFCSVRTADPTTTIPVSAPLPPPCPVDNCKLLAYSPSLPCPALQLRLDALGSPVVTEDRTIKESADGGGGDGVGDVFWKLKAGIRGVSAARILKANKAEGDTGRRSDVSVNDGDGDNVQCVWLPQEVWRYLQSVSGGGPTLSVSRSWLMSMNWDLDRDGDGDGDDMNTSISTTNDVSDDNTTTVTTTTNPTANNVMMMKDVQMAPAAQERLKEKDKKSNTKSKSNQDKDNSSITGTGTGVCFTCRNLGSDLRLGSGPAASTRCGRCHSVYYCSRDCQLAHWPFHKGVCKNKTGGEGGDVTVVVSSHVGGGGGGRVGLRNIGNSCYLSASLQALSHVAPLTRLLLSGRHQCDVNENNRDGSGGSGGGGGAALLKEYVVLLKELWLAPQSASSCSIAPTAIKRVLGRINPDYGGFGQHDAHDLLELLLDRLHEDLNRVTVKPYAPSPEGDGTDDASVAEEAWRQHQRRHDSVLRDLMGGQLRSRLRCTRCDRVAVSFDFTHTLQLALPPPPLPPVRVDILLLPTAYLGDEMGTGSGEEGGGSSNATVLWPPLPSLITVWISRPTTTFPSGSNASGKGSVSSSSSQSSLSSSSPFSSWLTVSVVRAALTEALKTTLLLSDNEEDETMLRGSDVDVDDVHLLLLSRDGHSVSRSLVTTEETGSSSNNNNDNNHNNQLLQRLLVTGTSGGGSSGGAGGGDMNRQRGSVLNGGGETLAAAVFRQCKHRHKPRPVSLSEHSITAEKTMDRAGKGKGDGSCANGGNDNDNDNGSSSSSGGGMVYLNVIKRLTTVSQSSSSTPNPTPTTPTPGRTTTNSSMSPSSPSVSFVLIGCPSVVAVPSHWTWTELKSRLHQLHSLLLHTGHMMKVMTTSDCKEEGEDRSTDTSSALPLIVGVRVGGSDPNIHPPSLTPLPPQEITVGEVLLGIETKKTMTNDFDDDDRWPVDWDRRSIAWQLPEGSMTDNRLDEMERRGPPLPSPSPLPHGPLSLEQCLQLFTREECLEGDNAWYCSHCQSHVAAKKALSLWRLPEVLVLGLKRFEFRDFPSTEMGQGLGHMGGGGGGTRQKLNRLVVFPLEGLDLSPFLSRTYNTAATTTGTGTVYDLFAVINHYGRMGFGHYTALAREWGAGGLSSQWYSYDDDDVQPCNAKDVVSEAAYVLFYRRRP
eukprot:gene5880-11876_t